jgi:hypothetical protein
LITERHFVPNLDDLAQTSPYAARSSPLEQETQEKKDRL